MPERCLDSTCPVCCVNCGHPSDDLEGGWCVNCLRAEVCCSDYTVAAWRMCGCRGRAAEALRRLRERGAA